MGSIYNHYLAPQSGNHQQGKKHLGRTEQYNHTTAHREEMLKMESKKLEIKEFYSSEDKEYWLEQIKKSDWRAGQYLYNQLSQGTLKELCGETTRVFLLIDDRSLVSFCILAEVDEVRDTGLTPWIGFVYTFPQYRGRRYVGRLLDFAQKTAKNDGANQVYISTGEIGLYEKYGYSFYQMMKTKDGADTRVYTRKL
ncbi:GNAT family N-acetyltransferase [Clostridium sp. MCC353]|nr:GNAT family N-acetyltransferase [Clostridium sp. MCC353]